MNKKELVEEVKKSLGWTKKDSKEVVETVVNTIVESLSNEDNVKLSGLGKFEVKTRSPRKARNPQTGEEIDVPAKNVVKFKASKNLKELIK